MGALSTYITQVQRLLHDPNAQFWSTSELTDYINEARNRVANELLIFAGLETDHGSTPSRPEPLGGGLGAGAAAGVR